MTRAPYTPTQRQRERRAEDDLFGRRRTDAPVPGLYAYRMRKGAPEIAAEIVHAPSPDPNFPENVMDRSPLWWVRISGQPDSDATPEPDDLVWRVYEYGRRIDRAEFAYLWADAAWCADNAPDQPRANPSRPVDLMTTPLPF